jgi:hypothetical protein
LKILFAIFIVGIVQTVPIWSANTGNGQLNYIECRKIQMSKPIRSHNSRRLFILLSISAYLLASYIGCQTDFKKGIEQLRRDNTQKAMDYFQKVTPNDGDFKEAQKILTSIKDSLSTMLGDSVYRQHHYQLAIESYNRVLHPDSTTLLRMSVANKMLAFDSLQNDLDRYQFLWTLFSTFTNQTVKNRRSKSTSYVPLRITQSRQRLLHRFPYEWWTPNWALFNIYLIVGDDAYCRDLYTEAICSYIGDRLFRSWSSGYYWLGNEFLVMNKYEINGVWQTAYLSSDVAILERNRQYFLLRYAGPTALTLTNGNVLETSRFEIIASLGYDRVAHVNQWGQEVGQATMQNVILTLSNALNSDLERIVVTENIKHSAASAQSSRGSDTDSTRWVKTAALGSGYIWGLTTHSGKIFVTTGNEVSLSTNDGRSWTYIGDGLSYVNPFGASVHVAVSGPNLFAGTDAGVFRSTNNGTNWTAVASGLTTTYITALVSSGNNLVAGTPHGAFLSTNNGASWSAISGMADIHISCLYMSGTTILAGAYGIVFVSTDNGETWTERSDGLPKGTLNALASIDNHIFAGIDLRSSGGNGGLFRLSNNNSTWARAGLSNTNINALALSGTHLFAGTPDGVFLSTDYGESWQAINHNLGNSEVTTLAVNNVYLFAGRLDGVWRRLLTKLY